jgi:hypothetical protein
MGAGNSKNVRKARRPERFVCLIGNILCISKQNTVNQGGVIRSE